MLVWSGLIMMGECMDGTGVSVLADARSRHVLGHDGQGRIATMHVAVLRCARRCILCDDDIATLQACGVGPR